MWKEYLKLYGMKSEKPISCRKIKWSLLLRDAHQIALLSKKKLIDYKVRILTTWLKNLNKDSKTETKTSLVMNMGAVLMDKIITGQWLTNIWICRLATCALLFRKRFKMMNSLQNMMYLITLHTTIFSTNQLPS